MAEAKKTIILRTSDGIDFEAEEDVAKVSKTIGNMIKDGVPDGVVTLPDVTGKVMTKIIEYAGKLVEYEKEGSSGDRDPKKWGNEFLELAKVDKPLLFDMITASHSLNIESLTDTLCLAVSDIIKDMTVEQVREYFNVTFTPEEEEEIRKQSEQVSAEHVWLLDF